MTPSVRIDGRRVVIDGHAVPARWLRDHGDDPASLDPDTKQRKVDTFSIPTDITARTVSVEAPVYSMADWGLQAALGSPAEAAPDTARRIASAGLCV